MLLMIISINSIAACGGGSSDDEPSGGGDIPNGGGGSGQQESIIGEWVGLYDRNTDSPMSPLSSITNNTEVTVTNIMSGGQGTITYYKYSSNKGWNYYTEKITYTLKGNQCTFVFQENEHEVFTFTYSITTKEGITTLVRSSGNVTMSFVKMTSVLRAQIQALNATERQDSASPIKGEWVRMTSTDMGTITDYTWVTILNFMDEEQGIYTDIFHAEYWNWFYVDQPMTYTVDGNQLTYNLPASRWIGEARTSTWNFSVDANGTSMTLYSGDNAYIYTKMNSELQAQINALNAKSYMDFDKELSGEWYMHFTSSKGEGYSILSFNNGYGKYLEYDNSGGKMSTTNEAFTYDYNNKVLTIKWNKGGQEVIDIYSYNTTSLDLINWPNKGDNWFNPLTDRARQEIEDFINGNKTRVKHWIYGENSVLEPPFRPGAWDYSEMRFSYTEGKHFPTLSDEVYFGYKTLIFDISDASDDCIFKVMNGWWSNYYADQVYISNGLWKLTITEQMAKECAKGGEGKDLVILLTSGSCTINSVYYEE